MVNYFSTIVVGHAKTYIRRFAKAKFEKPHLENLATAAGINYRQLSEYDDDNLPSAPVLKRLVSIGMSLDELFGGGGKPIATEPVAGFTILEDDSDEIESLSKTVRHLDHQIQKLKERRNGEKL